MRRARLLALCALAGAFHVPGDELGLSNFDVVLDDSRVWVVDVYSGMCGSCKAFSPIWTEWAGTLDNVRVGRMNIDTDDGLALAEKLGVLDQGVPHVCLFHEALASEDPHCTSLMDIDTVTTAKQLAKRLRPLVQSLDTDARGYLLKQR